jgi:hypothetical protein
MTFCWDKIWADVERFQLQEGPDIITWTLQKNTTCYVLVGLRGESRGAAATGVLQYPRVLFTAAARAARARESQPWGVRPRPDKREGFSFLICLIRLIHLLSLYREVYLTPKLLNP